MLSRLIQKLTHIPQGSQRNFTTPDGIESEQTFDEYEERMPHWQNAIDLIPGWNSSFPPELGLSAGHLAMADDPRIAWALDRMGDLTGKDVLEVGPLDGMHTAMLNTRRPRKIDAVEANRLCYLRCLVTDQILKLDRANFMLGDAVQWLERHDERYDLIVASGVLYHMADPVKFLELAAARTDALFLWTHYFSEQAMPPHDARRAPFSGREDRSVSHDVELRLYERRYRRNGGDSAFCGGARDRHYWMRKQDIVDLLKALSFASIDIDCADPDHPGGPCFSILARRK